MSTDQNMNEFKQSSLSENASADPGKNRSGGGRGPLILVLVLALAVICLLVYMMKKPGEKKAGPLLFSETSRTGRKGSGLFSFFFIAHQGL